MIKTYEELEALPRDTPIRDALGYVWGSAGLATEHAAECGYDTVLPAVRLIPATISQDKFRQAYIAARDSQSERTGVCSGIFKEDLTAALAVLGIEVSDE